jgi:hypothetical protein
MVKFWIKLVLMFCLWWDKDLSNFLISLTTTLSNLVSSKCMTIIAFESRYHDTKLRLLTRQPTQTLSQLIILNLQAINIMCKFQIFHSMQFTSRTGNRNFQISLKLNNASMKFINLSMQNRTRCAST